MSALLRIPEEFAARYPVIERLGAGATALVFRARQVSLDREVVVKLVRAPDPEDQMVIRALKEASLLAGLRHPRVVELLDHGVCEEVLYLVYPDEGGKALSMRKDLYGKSPEQAAALLRDILEGLEAIHEIGAVHRDVKPANVLILPDGSGKLIDLGLAKDLQDDLSLTVTGAAVGTPFYMAPGQVTLFDADPRDDLYAAGLIAYELLTGSNPFVSRDLHEVVERHLHLVPDPPHQVCDCPESLSWVVMALLEKDRDDRYPSAREALEALEISLEGPADAPPEERTQRVEPAAVERTRAVPRVRTDAVRPPAARSRAPLFVGAILSAMLLGYGLARFQSPSPAPTPAPTAPVEPASIWPPGLPPDYGDRLRRVYGTPPELDPDPAVRGRQIRERAELRPFFDWLRAGGAPETLGEEARSHLDEVDGAFLAQGATPPFSVFLRARPGRAGGIFPELLEGRAEGYGYKGAPGLWEKPMGPWTRIAVDQLLVIEDRSKVRRDSSREVADALLGGRDFDQIRSFREGLYHLPARRISQEQKHRQENRGIELLWYSTGRALRDEEPHAIAVMACIAVMVGIQESLASWVFLDPEDLFGSSLTTTAERILAADFYSLARSTRRKAMSQVPEDTEKHRRLVEDALLLGGVGVDVQWLHFRAHRQWVGDFPPRSDAELRRYWSDRARLRDRFTPLQYLIWLDAVVHEIFRDGKLTHPVEVWTELLDEYPDAVRAMPGGYRYVRSVGAARILKENGRWDPAWDVGR